MNLTAFASDFSPSKLRTKLASVPPKACRRVLREALRLFAILRDPETPLWAKGLIVGALGYFICPVDLVPDFLPGGLLDDVAVMAFALTRLAALDSKSVRRRVEELEERWGPDWLSPSNPD